MTVNTIKFSQFSVANLATTSNMSVGFGGGINYRTPFVVSWTNDGARPSPAYAGLLGFNIGRTQYEFFDGVNWIQLAAGGSGSVNPGSMNEVAYYATTGSAVSGLMTANNGVLVTDGSGAPSISSTLPASLNITQPNIIGITNGSVAAAGSVGEIISASVDFTSAVNLIDGTTVMITSITLSAGDWDVWAVAATKPQPATLTINYNAGISLSSSLLPPITINTAVAQLTNVHGSATESISMSVGPCAQNVTVPTAVYLLMNCSFTSGTLGGYGYIMARRIR